MAERVGFEPQNDSNPGGESTARANAIFTNLERYTVANGRSTPRVGIGLNVTRANRTPKRELRIELLLRAFVPQRAIACSGRLQPWHLWQPWQRFSVSYWRQRGLQRLIPTSRPKLPS
jgi:hypothetical protein